VTRSHEPLAEVSCQADNSRVFMAPPTFTQARRMSTLILVSKL
jgi:hypothetical protein